MPNVDIWFDLHKSTHSSYSYNHPSKAGVNMYIVHMCINGYNFNIVVWKLKSSNKNWQRLGLKPSNMSPPMYTIENRNWKRNAEYAILEDMETQKEKKKKKIGDIEEIKEITTVK